MFFYVAVITLIYNDVWSWCTLSKSVYLINANVSEWVGFWIETIFVLGWDTQENV